MNTKQTEASARRQAWLAGESVNLTYEDLRFAEDIRDERPRPSGNIVGKWNDTPFTANEAKASGLLADGVERFDFRTGTWVPAE